MDTGQFWGFIEAARRQVLDPADAKAVAARAVTLLTAQPSDMILAADQALQFLMADSYRIRLWAAAYVINSGCSDDGFDYFRGWLIMQGCQVYERVVADPDTLADHAAIQAMPSSTWPVECEDALYIASEAYRAATGRELPRAMFTIRYPELDADWDFDDRAEMAQRLPRLTALTSGKP